jgi:hypothetical protein
MAMLSAAIFFIKPDVRGKEIPLSHPEALDLVLLCTVVEVSLEECDLSMGVSGIKIL